MKQIISLQIDKQLVEKLKILANEKDMSVSALIRVIIKEFLSSK